jgi:hypothetical protein
MKLYEIYFRNNCSVKNNKYFLNKYNWKIKPYEFLGGFCVELNSKGDVKCVKESHKIL